MALNVKVKNTFLEVKLDIAHVAPALPRSSSVPRAFKPCCNADCTLEDDGSTSTTDGGFAECQTVLTDLDYQDSLKDFDEASTEVPSQQASDNGRWADVDDSDVEENDDDVKATCSDNEDKSKVTLSLVDMVEEAAQARSKLRSSAQAFQSSVVRPPDEVTHVMSQVVDNVKGEGRCDVQLQDGYMGGAMLICQPCDPFASSTSILNSVKDSVLAAAAESENTYVMGYNAQPFADLDPSSFSMSIGCIPAAHRNTACWDTYMYGCCPRIGKCRWDHPTESDIMRCIVVVKEAPMMEQI